MWNAFSLLVIWPCLISSLMYPSDPHVFPFYITSVIVSTLSPYPAPGTMLMLCISQHFPNFTKDAYHLGFLLKVQSLVLNPDSLNHNLQGVV